MTTIRQETKGRTFLIAAIVQSPFPHKPQAYINTYLPKSWLIEVSTADDYFINFRHSDRIKFVARIFVSIIF